jgi:broad specificity phosphatase PhoE
LTIPNPDEYQKGKTLVYFVRHTEKDKTDSSKDSPLTKIGRMHANKITQQFLPYKNIIDKIYVSELIRAVETAKPLEKILHKKAIPIKELQEFNAIVWRREWWKIYFWICWIRHKKSIHLFNKILKKEKNKVIIVVCHGNVIKGILGNKLGLSLKKIKCFNTHYGGISLVYFSGKKVDYIQFYDSKKILKNTYN